MTLGTSENQVNGTKAKKESEMNYYKIVLKCVMYPVSKSEDTSNRGLEINNF